MSDSSAYDIKDRSFIIVKAYLFCHSNLCPEKQAQAILSEIDAIATWVQPFPHAVLVVSDLSVHDLTRVLGERLDETWFLLTELNGATVNGLLPGKLWRLVNDPDVPWQPSKSVSAQN